VTPGDQADFAAWIIQGGQAKMPPAGEIDFSESLLYAQFKDVTIGACRHA